MNHAQDYANILNSKQTFTYTFKGIVHLKMSIKLLISNHERLTN